MAPLTATVTTAPYGNYEEPFNLPFLAESCGAVYVARWTTYHVRQLTKAMTEALTKKGFAFVEVLSPCPTLYSRRNRLGDGLDQMKYYKESGVIRNGAPTNEVGIGFGGELVLGKFVDKERPPYHEAMQSHLVNVLGDSYRNLERA